MSLKIIQITPNDEGGGGVACARLHEGLSQSGASSTLFCKRTIKPRSGTICFKPETSFKSRMVRRLRRNQISRVNTPVRPKTPSLYSFDLRVDFGNEVTRQLPVGDLYHLHSTFGFVDLEAFFAQPLNGPRIWTIHQMNAFTGGCLYSLGCSHYERSCGSCPILGTEGVENDFSRAVWQAKQRIFGRLQSHELRLVAPSRWMADCLARSSLLSRFEQRIIPYGLDTTVFRPLDKRLAREILGVAHDLPLIAFVSQFGGNKAVKGFDCLMRALQVLLDERQIRFGALVAGPYLEDRQLLSIPVIETGNIAQEWMLRAVYSAADVLVVPSREDNLPNVVLEALACGTPVIGSRVGGIPEMINHGQDGFLFSSEDEGELANCLFELLTHPELGQKMSRNARQKVLDHYTLEHQAKAMMNYYEEAMTAWNSAKH